MIVLLLLTSLVALDLERRRLSGQFVNDDVEIKVLYSSEKAGWLQAIKSDFLNFWNSENPGKQLKLTMVPIGTAKGTIQIAQGASEPTIWSPASSFWLPLLNTLVEDAGQAPIVDPSTSQSPVSSPTVIVTWKTYQERTNLTSVEDIHRLALTDPTFSLAHTDPFESNGGFTAVIMQVAAAANKSPEQLTLKDLESDQVYNWMRETQRSIVHYGSSTGFLAKFMASEGPNSLKAAFLYENLVVEKNKELQFRIDQGDIPADQKLVAVYPDEGVLNNDHPFAIINRPYVSAEERKVAREFIQFLSEPQQQETAVEYGFRVATAVNQSLLEQQFNPANGVIRSLSNLTIFNAGAMNGQVVQRIPDVWSATRSRSLSDTGATDKLTTRDFIIPAIFLGILVVMVMYPVIRAIKPRWNP